MMSIMCEAVRITEDRIQIMFGDMADGLSIDRFTTWTATAPPPTPLEMCASLATAMMIETIVGM